jgi:5-methyltetrahydrofolate--homocysteine methyltransferase
MKEPGVLAKILHHILEGDAPAATECVQQALADGMDPAVILNEAMIAAMDETGRRFEAGEMYVPEMLIAGRAMQSALGSLKPFLVQADIEPLGKVVIGTVQGDLHDIGKNLVSLMLQGAGLEVIDLGTDVAPASFVEAVRKHQPQLVAMSALLTTTMTNMGATVAALRAAGLRDRVNVIVGGAPVTGQFADQIGADLYAPDAASAARTARTLVGRVSSA